jgi:cytochrome P450
VVDQILLGRRNGQAPGGDDLLGRLLAVRDSDTGQGLDDAEIRAQVLLFLLAGHETTASALTFTLHLLGHHPDAQQRVPERPGPSTHRSSFACHPRTACRRPGYEGSATAP